MKKKALLISLAVAAALLLLAVILWLTADRTNTVGICFRESTNSENTAYRQQLQDALIKQGFEVIVMDADGDQVKQIEQIGKLAQKKCDVLLIEPVMKDAAEELLSAIAETQLPAVLFDRQIDTQLLENYPQIAYIGWDEKESGQLQAQLMMELPNGGDLNGDGTVSYILLCGPVDHQDAIARAEGFEAVLENAQQLSAENGDWTVDSGRRICKQQLAAYGKDIEVVVCGNDQMAVGAAQAIADGGRTVGKDIYLLAIGSEGETLQMIEQGKISETVYRDMAVQIDTIAQTVLSKFQQQPVQSVQILPYTTAEN